MPAGGEEAGGEALGEGEDEVPSVPGRADGDVLGLGDGEAFVGGGDVGVGSACAGTVDGLGCVLVVAPTLGTTGLSTVSRLSLDADGVTAAG